MSEQNKTADQFNKAKWNNYFVQGSNSVGRQVLTKKQLDQQRRNDQIDGTPRSYEREGTILVQDTIGSTPEEYRLRQPKQETSTESITYKSHFNLFFSMRKMIKYLNMHRLNVFNPSGPIAETVLSNPKIQPALSNPLTSNQIDRLYDAQFNTLGNGAGATNNFTAETSSPLPNSVDRDEFRRRLDTANLAAIYDDNLKLSGLNDNENINGSISDAVEQATFSIRSNQLTQLEKACIDKSVT